MIFPHKNVNMTDSNKLRISHHNNNNLQSVENPSSSSVTRHIISFIFGMK